MKKANLLAAIVLCANAVALNAVAETTQTKHPVVKEQRPDFKRGWVIIEKRNYWPLSFEALDRLESIRAKDLAGDSEKLSEQLDKCSAWLGMAASASMLGKDSNIYSVIDLIEDLSQRVTEENHSPDPAVLNDLATMGELSIANSHVKRAAQDYSEPRQNSQYASSATKSKLVEEGETEIRQARLENNIEQFRYDTAQAIRHLTVARSYLETAAKHNGFEDSLAEIEVAVPLTGKEPVSELSRMTSNLDILNDKMSDLIAKRQTQLAKSMAGKL